MNTMIPGPVRFIIYIALSFYFLSGTNVYAVEQKSVHLADGSDIQAEVYGKSHQTRILWIAPSYGIQPRHQRVASNLADHGYEVWLVDLVDALFLTRSANTMRRIPPVVVTNLIKELTKEGHNLLILSSSYGSIPTLRGVQYWQAEKPSVASVIGVVLFTPYLYNSVPPLGQAPDFIPVQTSVPVYIFQAAKNANRWHFADLLTHLQQSATVYSEIMPGVTSMFYDEDNADATRKTLQNIAARIKQRIPLLAGHRYPLTAPAVIADKTQVSGLDEKLKPYHGKVQAMPFSLQDVQGRNYRRNNFTGKVTVINFWASWCPPCVEEIPSLNRLREKMQGKDFELISINYAESPDRIQRFMQQVAVNFPVLIDPEGRLAGEWKVVAFPSTFVIAPDGKIKYGVNAAIHWDSEEVIHKLNSLLE